MLPKLTSSPVITRYEHNPVLSKDNVAFESVLVFNAGVIKHEGKYIMVFRNDYDYRGGSYFHDINLGIAYSGDGYNWKAESKPFFEMSMINDGEIGRIYDPRLTVIDGRVYICFAADTRHGLRGGIAYTTDFTDFNIVSMSVPDNRNMVLFPEKIGGHYIRLERPMPVYSHGGKDRFDTWMSYSPDLKFWGESKLILPVEAVPYSNDKVGPAAPPVKTDKGWLTLFHAVDIDHSRGKNGWEDFWRKRYCAGVMLLDLDDPSKVIGVAKEPLLAPEAPYELDGFRTHVIFPGGMILEDDGSVKIYYGASDTVECVATAGVDDLISLCLK